MAVGGVVAIETKDIVTMATASVGAVLGIVNTINSLWRDRLRVRVKAESMVLLGQGSGSQRHVVAVFVTNLSTVPITISGVGLHLKGSKSMLMFMRPLSSKGTTLPYRLEARDSEVFYSNESIYKDQELMSVDYSYAQTGCGKLIKGKTGEIREYARQFATARN